MTSYKQQCFRLSKGKDGCHVFFGNLQKSVWSQYFPPSNAAHGDGGRPKSPCLCLCLCLSLGSAVVQQDKTYLPAPFLALVTKTQVTEDDRQEPFQLWHSAQPDQGLRRRSLEGTGGRLLELRGGVHRCQTSEIKTDKVSWFMCWCKIRNLLQT